MKSDEQEYEYVKGDANDQELEMYKQCFVKNGSLKKVEDLNWLHRQNLLGTNLIYYVIERSSGNVVGINSVIPVSFLINSNLLPAVQAIDALIDENHRGKKLFIKLVKLLHSAAEKANFELAYGFPNANSAHSFFNRLDWVSFGEAPFLIKPLRISYFIKKIFKKNSIAKNSRTPEFIIPMETDNNEFKIKSVEKFEKDFDDLWQSTSLSIKVCVNRNSDYMNWRYINKPGENYYKYGLYIKNKLSGIVVFTLKNKHDGLVGYLMELIYLPPNINHGKELLQFATKFLRSQKADVILAWCIKNSFNYPAYKKSNYFPFPPTLRPQKLFFGVKVFNKKNFELISKVENWYISYSDSDTV